MQGIYLIDSANPHVTQTEKQLRFSDVVIVRARDGFTDDETSSLCFSRDKTRSRVVKKELTFFFFLTDKVEREVCAK